MITDVQLLFKSQGFWNYISCWSEGGILRNCANSHSFPFVLCHSGGSAVKNLPAMQEKWVQSLVGEDPLEEGMATTPVFLPGKSPRIEEPCELQPMELQRVGQWSNWTHVHRALKWHNTYHSDKSVVNSRAYWNIKKSSLTQFNKEKQQNRNQKTVLTYILV